MSKILRHAGLLASAAFVLSIGSAALAGEPVSRKTGSPKGERKVVVIKDGQVVSSDHAGGPTRMHRDPAARADHMRMILQLRPEQEAAFQAFLEATKPQARRFEMKHDKDGRPSESVGPHKALTTPERLDMQAKRMAERQAAFSKRAAATRAFYGQLNASQQKVFDTLHARHGGRRHMRIDRRGGQGGPGGHGDRMILRGGPEHGAPMPGGMASGDLDVEEFAMLDGEEMDVRVFADGEAFGGDDEE